MNIFNKNLLTQRKNNNAKDIVNFLFLRKEIVERTIEQIQDTTKHYDNILDINCYLGDVYAHLSKYPDKYKNITQIDSSKNILELNPHKNKICMDIEELNFPNKSFDLIVAIFSLHNCNNLKQTISKIYEILKPGGLFISSTPTVGTLENLQSSLMQTELKLTKKYSPRVHPFVDMKSLADLIHNCKFKDVVSTQDSIEIMYKNFISILKDLKGSAQNNILTNQNYDILPKLFFKELDQNYKQYQCQETLCYPVEVKFCSILAWKE